MTGLTLQSIGWDFGKECGACPGTFFQERPGKEDIFLCEFRNYRRLDAMSRAVCTAIAFALRGAGRYPAPGKLAISSYFSDSEGACRADRTYFRDFIEFGALAGRANLFIYTLPTSPLGEASVHFGLSGGISYMVPGESDNESALQLLLAAAEDAHRFRGENSFLIGIGDWRDKSPRCLFLYLEAVCGADAGTDLSGFTDSDPKQLCEQLCTQLRTLYADA